MKREATSKGMILNRVIALAFCLAICSCVVIRERSFGLDGIPNENHAAKSKDFTIEGYRKSFNGQGVVMRYKVGDRFRLRKQMFLSYSAENLVQLRELSTATVPRIEEYRKNPGAYRYGGENPYQVIKVVPAGTVIEIVKIAEIDLSPYPYFVRSVWKSPASNSPILLRGVPLKRPMELRCKCGHAASG